MLITKTSLRTVLALLLFAGLTACGGGSESSTEAPPVAEVPPAEQPPAEEPPVEEPPAEEPPVAVPPAQNNQAPVASLLFPQSGSYTSGNFITVRGTAKDPDGDAIAAVTINGVAATSDNGFANWQVTNLPLQQGSNVLQGIIRDVHGNEASFSIELQKQLPTSTLLEGVEDMVIDSTGAEPRLLLVDRYIEAVIAVDLKEGPTKGHRSIISQNGDGNGVNFVGTESMDIDPIRNRVLVLDYSSLNNGKVLSVDLLSGQRTEIVNGLKAPRVLLVDPLAERFLVADRKVLSTDPNGVDGLFQFDLLDPASSGYDPLDRPGSPNLVVDGLLAPRSLDTDPNDPNRVMVSTTSLNIEALFEVDIDGKNKTQLANFVNAGSVAFYPGDSNRVLQSSNAALLEVNLNDAQMKLMSGQGNVAETNSDVIVGKGPIIQEYNDIEFAPDNNDLVYVLPYYINRIFSVDLRSGDRVALDESLGDGPELLNPANLAILPNAVAGQRPTLLVLDSSVYRIDLAAQVSPADRVTVSGFDADNPNQPKGSGTALIFPSTIVADGTNNRLLVTDGGLKAVVEVDATTGDRKIVSAQGVGAGPEITSSTAIALDQTNNRVFVGSYDTVLAVDLQTGDRTVISDADTGTGPKLSGVLDLQFDAVNNRLLATKDFLSVTSPAGLMAINMQTGERTVIADDTVGSGVKLQGPVSVSLDLQRNRALIVDAEYKAVFAVNLANGDRTVLSISDAGADQLFDTDDDYIVGGGTPFNLNGELSHAVFDADSQTLYITDAAAGSVIAVDTVTGDRVLASGFMF